MFKGFWEKLKGPIVGLSPMDGVTDAGFRYMVCKHSQPSFVVTEFTNVEGLARGAVKMLQAFLYDESERPIVAQVYGVEVDSFYKAAVMLCNLGFDGIDINMGCPANKVAKKGSGAGLIQTPELAKKIVRAVQKGVEDYANGISMEEAGVHPNIIVAVNEMAESHEVERRLIPVSVKTRIGYDKEIVEEWMVHLVETKPALIALHGRTLKQMYLGEADWEAIARAGKIVKDAGIMFLGNGDVKSMKDAEEKIKKYNVDGVLVGRATFGNPWFFASEEPSHLDRFDAAIEHSRLIEEKYPNILFVSIRKHLAWYMKGFDGAKELRMNLMKAEDASGVETIIKKYIESNHE